MHNKYAQNQLKPPKSQTPERGKVRADGYKINGDTVGILRGLRKSTTACKESQQIGSSDFFLATLLTTGRPNSCLLLSKLSCPQRDPS